MSMLDDIAEREKARTSWQPQTAGACLAGTVVAIREYNNEYGTMRFLDLEVENGTDLVSVLCRTVLWNEVCRQKVAVGDLIGIKYLGKGPKYHDYILMVRKPEGGAQ